MKEKLLLLLLTTASFASFQNINSFEADFKQNIVDDKNKTISYFGHIKAEKPQYALWNYTKPIQKSVYIFSNQAVIIEPDLEQAIIKHIKHNLDFFKLIKNAKQLSRNRYLAHYNNTDFYITIKKDLINSISYKDEFENNVTILFSNQVENKKINKMDFKPMIPDDYDVIRN
jgi:outer membrane lipoprotein carrier protein